MSAFLTTTLVLHVLTGVLATAAAYGVWMHLLKPKFNPAAVRAWAYTGFFSVVLSWVTAAWYYVKYYGGQVKPVVLAGRYAWAHEFFMEWKEHIFLFMPLLAVVLLFATWKLQPDDPASDSRRRAAATVAAVLALLGIAVTLSGVFVSGAVRTR